MVNYVGDDIQIEEMPQGCVISPVGEDKVHQYLVLRSTRDALSLIDSLQRMIDAQKSKGLE